MSRILLSVVVYLAIIPSAWGAPLRVVSLHPLIGDILKQVGGSAVEVVDLIGMNGDPHSFEPHAEDLMAANSGEIYFVSGMGLENYLPELKTILKDRAKVVEVGATLPGLHGSSDEKDDHDHDHDHELDPHWWHSIDIFRRAVDVVAEELKIARPAQREVFEANARSYQEELDRLKVWVRKELSRIPKDNRKLATAHAAFRYFCEDFGFQSISVQGMTREQMPDANSFLKLIKTLEERNVTAVFPERESNPKMLESLTRDTGIRLGGELIADGRGVKSYELMMRKNVETIVNALAGE